LIRLLKMAVVPFAILFREVWKVVEQLEQLEHVGLWPILEKKMHSLWLRTSDHHWELCKSMLQSVDVGTCRI
jgi:hypothetical protein